VQDNNFDEVFYTEEYDELLRRLKRVVGNYERDLITACNSAPAEDIRWKAGRVTGLRIAVELLEKAQQHG